MQFPITCIIIAPQRAEGWPECDQMQVIELNPSLPGDLCCTPCSGALRNGSPGWMRCWQCINVLVLIKQGNYEVLGSSSLGLMQGVQDLLQTLIYLLKLCLAGSEQGATASNPWDRGFFGD